MNKFNYNQEQASQVGGGQYVTKSGGYDLKIVRAEFSKNQNSSAESLELDFVTREGMKLNYISINFTKGNGEPNDFGHKMVQAIMGVTGVVNLSQGNGGSCPELFNKGLKGVVQRVDYTKTSGNNAGQDGYKFDFKLPANIQTGKTVKEAITNDEAKSFSQYASSVEDKDERVVKFDNQHAPQQQSGGFQQPGIQQQAPAIDFDDDLPF